MVEKDQNNSVKDDVNESHTVLIVEDDEGLSRLIAKGLKNTGFDVGVVHNGIQAIDWVVNNNPPELILLDYKLPDMSGREVVEALKERRIEIPFIIMTGHGDEKIAVEMMKAGAKDYIVKEGEFFELLPTVIKWVFEELQRAKELVQANKALEESENKYRLLVDNALVGVYKANLKGDILYANKALSRMFGYESPEEMMLDHVLQSDKGKKEWNVLMEKLKETGSVDNFEIETVTKTGETINIILSWSLVGDIVSGMIIDITEHKQVEKRMLHSEKLKAMGVMAAGIAHDFNNMLAIIAGNAQLLHGSHGDDKELTDRLSTICKAANDGAEIVRRMRKFMVVKTDVSEFISVNIKDVIEQSVDFTMPRWKNMARAGGIKYDIDMKGVKEVPAIPGNPSELREVLINIINNALHVMPEGGTVLFCTWSNDNNVYVSISDSGTGMSEEVKEKIFDPFFTTKRAEGSGLGMSVSYGIVKSHGGNIEVESEDGKGCTFTLKFPIDRETRQSMVLPESTHKIKLEKLRILVIDDEEEICSILERFFSRNGHKVKSFMNCAKAIKILKSEEFDLVLCDLVMPDLTGHDVIEVMDKLERRPKIGLITGWDEKIETKDTEELKVDFIIKKPFEFSTLTRFINDILDARLKDL
jgi:PAS domain S-box-containing protein